MAKACGPTKAESDRNYIATLTDDDVLEGIGKHADPTWWKEHWIAKSNQAYLRRWGSYLRREARKRGLL